MTFRLVESRSFDLDLHQGAFALLLESFSPQFDPDQRSHLAILHTASKSTGGSYARRFDSGFGSCGLCFRDLRRCVDLGQFPDRTSAARAGRRQQKAPQLLITPRRVSGPTALFPGPTNSLGTLFSQFDLDQIIGSEIEADKVGRTREESNQMVLANPHSRKIRICTAAYSFTKRTDSEGKLRLASSRPKRGWRRIASHHLLLGRKMYQIVGPEMPRLDRIAAME